MTYKHIDFASSPVMRSLEKIAIEKGLVANDSLIKTASTSNTLDFTPSANLMENILKLGAGLRNLGLDKYADELESKFLGYKQANNLYNVYKETGEDLVDSAHPEGSHDLQGVSGDATVETILDKHLKMINVVNKKPTGKLSSANKIIDAVKHAIAQQIGSEYNINSFLDQPKTDNIEEKLSSEAGWTDGDRANANFIKYNMVNAITPLIKIIPLLNELESLSKDSRFTPGTSNAIGAGKEFVQNFINSYLDACNVAFKMARLAEKQRLTNVSDLNQSRVSFKEIGNAFKLGELSKTRLSHASNYNDIIESVNSLSRGMGNLIFDKFSPAFDFDQPFMKSVKDKAFEIFSQIKQNVGSK